MNKTLKNKKVLITGGAGFIGSNLADQLLKQNDIFGTNLRQRGENC